MTKKLLIAIALVCAAYGALHLYKIHAHTIAPDQLNIHFLDIGQGDATLVTFGTGEQMLIDCAIDARILEALGRTLPFYDRTIEYLVVTHPDLDHYGGCIDVLERFDITHIYYTGVAKHNAYHTAFEQVLAAHPGTEFLVAPRRFAFGSTTVEMLYPTEPLARESDEPNNTSVIVLLTHIGHTALLMGDAEKEQEERLLEQYESKLDVDVLKVGHHGSKTSSIQDFVDATTPQHAVISAGGENSYGHPHLGVVRRFERASSTIWRTDKQGDILVAFTSDGMYVETGR